MFWGREIVTFPLFFEKIFTTLKRLCFQRFEPNRFIDNPSRFTRHHSDGMAFASRGILRGKKILCILLDNPKGCISLRYRTITVAVTIFYKIH